MRISKHKAYQVSRLMTQTKRENAEKLEKEFSAFVLLKYMDSLPKEIIHMYQSQEYNQSER